MKKKTGSLKKKRQKSKGEITCLMPHHKTSNNDIPDDKKNGRTDNPVVVLRNIYATGRERVCKSRECDRPETQPELGHSVELDVLNSVLAHHEKQPDASITHHKTIKNDIPADKKNGRTDNAVVVLRDIYATGRRKRACKRRECDKPATQPELGHSVEPDVLNSLLAHHKKQPDASITHHKTSKNDIPADKKNDRTDNAVVVLRDIYATGRKRVCKRRECDKPATQPELGHSVELDVLNSVLAHHKKQPDASITHHKTIKNDIPADKKNGRTDNAVVVLRDIYATGRKRACKRRECDKLETQPNASTTHHKTCKNDTIANKKSGRTGNAVDIYATACRRSLGTSDVEISKGPNNVRKKYTTIQGIKGGDPGLRVETSKPSTRLSRSSLALRTKSELDSYNDGCTKEVSKSKSKRHSRRPPRLRSAAGSRCSSQLLVERSGKELTGDRNKRQSPKRMSKRTQPKKNYYECETDSSSENESRLRRTVTRHKRPSGVADIAVPPIMKLFSDQSKAAETKTKKNNGETKSRSKSKGGKRGRGRSSSAVNGERKTESRKEQVVNPDTWSKQETDNLYRAVTKHAPDDPCFWMLVSAAVATRSEEECQEFYYRPVAKDKHSSNGSKSKTKAAKPSKPVALTGRVGTLKRKRELRQLVDQHNEGYEDDFFDSTPMKKHIYKAPVLGDEDEDDLFGDKLPFDTPMMTRTPFTRCVAPVSPKKTPYMRQESPNMSANRHEMDPYINRMKKRRIVSNVNRPKEKISVDVQYTDDLFRKEEQSDHDSEQESDYYWSDVLGT